MAQRPRPDRHLRVIATLTLSLLLAPTHNNLFAAETPNPAPPQRRFGNVERLALPRLQAVHNDVLQWKRRRTSLEPIPGLTDFRCILHAHAEDSTHTGGTLPEMLADAKKAGVHAIFLSDHFRPPRDFITGRWRGLKEGVLFVPGSEIRGFLIHPTNSILDRMEQPVPEFIRTVAAGDGLIFLSHIEERPTHSTEGLTGLEIYNRHWDAKKDMPSLLALAMKLTDPAQLAELQEAVRLYPAELLGFQCDYPAVYLDKWDADTQARRLTGVAANDCHHNQVFIVKMIDANTVILGTIVDKDADMRKLTSALRPGIRQMTQGRQPGEVLARVDLDPYHRSFLNSSTHILAPSLDEQTLRTGLKAGHAYVAHDWMCDPTGFRFQAVGPDGQVVAMMGEELPRARAARLTARLPVPAFVRLIRNGREIARLEAAETLDYTLTEPGVYRLEAWLSLDGEQRPWVFSNPIYLR